MCYLKLLLFPFLLLLGFNMTDSKLYPSRWLITKGCTLKVEGSTTVNKFSCVISSNFSPDTLTFSRGGEGESVRMTGSMKLDIREFNCHNSVMTADLRKTLKSKEYPRMKIRFISLNRYPESSTRPYPVNGLVSIELAGVTRNFTVAYMVMPAGKNALFLKGMREINFSDFNIIPPRKIGGMIQTSDKLVAEFNLVLQELI
ncbi:YceI family protein [Daejeonella sp.]|uniref:YceI family protein n=1 Tax=Daejeonella sp. TaxID=2805397 RepID=UPI0030C62B37